MGPICRVWGWAEGHGALRVVGAGKPQWRGSLLGFRSPCSEVVDLGCRGGLPLGEGEEAGLRRPKEGEPVQETGVAGWGGNRGTCRRSLGSGHHGLSVGSADARSLQTRKIRPASVSRPAPALAVRSLLTPRAGWRAPVSSASPLPRAWGSGQYVHTIPSSWVFPAGPEKVRFRQFSLRV